MRKITIVFPLALLMMLGTKLSAQTYTTGIGLRLTAWYGLTVKHHLGSDVAIEGILNTRWHGWIITGLYEKHFPAFGQDGLRWYIGAGAHVGFWGNRYHPGNNWWDEDDDAHVGVGVDLIGGIEYTIPNVPINLSLDIKPGFNVIPGFFPIYDDGALSIRYVF